MVGEEPGHLGGRLQVALRIGLQAVAGLDQGAALADAGEHVLQGAPVGVVVERIRDRHHRRAEALPDPGEAAEPTPLVAAITMARAEKNAAGGRLRQGGEMAGEDGIVLLRRERDEDLPPCRREHVRDTEPARALLRAAVAVREQPAEPSVTVAVHRIGHGLEPLLGDEADPRQVADRRFARLLPALGLGMAAHHARQRVAVGDADGVEPEFGTLRHHFLRMRGSAQEREIRGHRQFGIGESCID